MAWSEPSSRADLTLRSLPAGIRSLPRTWTCTYRYCVRYVGVSSSLSDVTHSHQGLTDLCRPHMSAAVRLTFANMGSSFLFLNPEPTVLRVPCPFYTRETLRSVCMYISRSTHPPRMTGHCRLLPLRGQSKTPETYGCYRGRARRPLGMGISIRASSRECSSRAYSLSPVCRSRTCSLLDCRSQMR